MYSDIVCKRYETLTGKDYEDAVAANAPYENEYRLLSRLLADCKYFCGNGFGAAKYLWADNIAGHIAIMRVTYSVLPNAPEWLTKDNIDAWERAMYEVEKIAQHRNEFTVERVRRSVTQGEAVVCFRGVKLINYGDDIVINGKINPCGGWGSYKRDEVFINALLQPVEWHYLVAREVEADKARRNAVLALIDGADANAVSKSLEWTFGNYN